MNIITKIREEIETDENLRRTRSQIFKGARACPSASTEYFLDKLPVLRWLSNYHYKWLLRDVVVGVTVGMLLIPQACLCEDCQDSFDFWPTRILAWTCFVCRNGNIER